MSAYIVFKTKMNDKNLMAAALSEACQQLNMKFDAAEGNTLVLVDWHGQPRPERAQFRIPRRSLDFLSNDMGFEWTDDGYRAIISDYDKSGRAALLLARTKTIYNAMRVVHDARLAGYLPETENYQPDLDGNIVIKVRPVEEMATL